MSRDLVCFSHLRWDFVFQRPNHLMARAAQGRRVFLIEEPLLEPQADPHLRSVMRQGVTVVTPVLASELPDALVESTLTGLVDRLFRKEGIHRPVVWYYTPMALPWTRHIDASLTVFDSMDHLAGFDGAPEGLLALESELVAQADLVFSGGSSLHERMRGRHHDAHCFPSSVDVGHFEAARAWEVDPADQADIPRPRLGYAGVIDERLDLGLIAGVASARPDLQIILVGPIAKIAPGDIPKAPNIRQLGTKPYAELPVYLGGWDIGWMPFARNDATRFISPTKTPEYLAAGLPVVSTSIRDVIEPYGRLGFAAIADSVEDTLAAISRVEAGEHAPAGAVDEFLAARSWDATWNAMEALLESRLDQRQAGERPAIRLHGGLRRVPEMRTSLEGAATMTMSRGRSGEDA